MWPVSGNFTTAVAGTHTIATSVQVYSGSQYLSDLAVTDGNVSVDRTRGVRRQCTLTLTDPDGTLVPTGPNDLLAPYGNEIRISRGVRFDDGTTELVPQGVFAITGVSADSGDGVVITVTGDDRSRIVTRNRWIDPYQITAGQDVAGVIAAILASRYPGVVYDLPATGWTAGAVVLEAGESSDPWADAVAVANAAGLDLAFDQNGVARLFDPGAALAAGPVATYSDSDVTVLLGASREISTETTYSGVVASGESSSLTAPVSATVWDTDPTSPTYYLGPFGMVPLFYTSPLLVTTDQCTAAARTRLGNVSGGVESLSWSQLVNPALDAGDVISITESGTKANATVILDALTIPLLASNGMDATARTVRFG